MCPATSVNNVSDGSHALLHDAGVVSMQSAPGEVVLTVGSGHYQLHVPSTAPLPARRSHWLAALLVAALLLAIGLAAGAVAADRHARRALPATPAS